MWTARGTSLPVGVSGYRVNATSIVLGFDSGIAFDSEW